jgi:RNA polymerase primary sigma factor
MNKHTTKRKMKSARPEAVEPFLDEEMAEDRAHVPTEDDGPAAGDALGLYLQQMAAIPMLNRRQELELAQRLERIRRRYRHAALCSWWVVSRVLDTFERGLAGQVNLERSVDVVPSLGLTHEGIRARLPHHLPELRRLMDEGTAAFRHTLTGKAAGRKRARRQGRALLRQAVRLAEELSPSTELIDGWVQELAALAARADDLARQVQATPDDPRVRSELQGAVLQARATPAELGRLLAVVRRRQALLHQVRRELAQANLRLVVSIAKRYRNKGLAFADLIQEGNSGLMRAVDKFDHRLGFKFGTYATWWIRQGVTRALADHSRMVRIPCHRIPILSAIEQARGELMVRHGRAPSEEEVAATLGMTVKDLRTLTAVGRAPVSIQEAFGEDDDTWASFLSDEAAPSPGEQADAHLLKERVAEVLRCLAPRDREVVELRFGLIDGQARTLDEVAQVLGITRERVRQIEGRALDRLRQPGRREQLAGFAEVA